MGKTRKNYETVRNEQNLGFFGQKKFKINNKNLCGADVRCEEGDWERFNMSLPLW